MHTNSMVMLQELFITLFPNKYLRGEKMHVIQTVTTSDTKRNGYSIVYIHNNKIKHADYAYKL